MRISLIGSKEIDEAVPIRTAPKAPFLLGLGTRNVAGTHALIEVVIRDSVAPAPYSLLLTVPGARQLSRLFQDAVDHYVNQTDETESRSNDT